MCGRKNLKIVEAEAIPDHIHALDRMKEFASDIKVSATNFGEDGEQWKSLVKFRGKASNV